MRPILAAIAAVALMGGLEACGTATPYQPRVEGAHEGGYSEERLAPDRWRVLFSGNTLTSRETVESYLLYRAAELTVQQGADWFETKEARTETRTHAYLQQDPYYGEGFGAAYGWGWRPNWRAYRPDRGWREVDPAKDDMFWTDPAELKEVTRYVASVQIVIGKSPMPAGQRVFDARMVMQSLGPGIARPRG